MTFTCNLLLHTLPAIERQEKAAREAAIEADPFSIWPPHLRQIIESKPGPPLAVRADHPDEARALDLEAEAQSAK